MSSQLAFVFADDRSGKIKDKDRELIRSRCMKGVNKRENSRRSLEARRQAARPKGPKHQKAAIRSHAASESLLENPAFNGGRAPAASRNRHTLLPYADPTLGGEIIRYTREDTPTYPRELISCSDIFKYAKSIVYPIYQYVYFHDKIEEDPLRWLVQDDLFRHAVQFQVSVHMERMQQKPLSAITHKYYRTTVALLNIRLSGGANGFLTDTTIWSINILANAAVWLARHAEISTHASALEQLINLCGGTSYLLERPTMRYQLHCIELASFAASGNNAKSSYLNYPSCISANPVYTMQRPQQCLYDIHLSSSALLESMDELLDARIVEVFRKFQEVIMGINVRRARNQLLDLSSFQASYESVWFPLLHLGGFLNDILSESLRLGLLAFLVVTAIRDPASRVSRATKDELYPYLTDSLRNTCRATELSEPPLRRLMFWLLTISAMSVFNLDREQWLVDKWKETANMIPGVLTKWEVARDELESVMWIQSIHDDMGRQCYEEIREMS